jgi:hypothetical protein
MTDQNPDRKPVNPRVEAQGQIDRVAIQQIILRERIARDTHRWEELAACFSVDSRVEMSWFTGTGAEFASASAKLSEGGGLSTFHEVGPAFIAVRGARALADSGMTLHLNTNVDGADVALIGYVRMFQRFERLKDSWLIAGLRSVYVHDLIVAQNPSIVPRIDPVALKKLRPSYRYLSYLLNQNGHSTRDDLPGTDMPETVSKLNNADKAWLYDQV